MYLQRLEIAGFKSFGDRVKLDLEPGVSAIVGPNGSGKSNIAEAIRWVLGERAGRVLRATKTEELIFSGTERGKAKSSLAEVSITLAKRDHDSGLVNEKLKIVRRLYRSGESEYRINGRSVRARQVAKILAQAGFGVSSYTVIGQGMVDKIIIASSAERKLLFEEASGIRAFELERAETIAKLRQAREQAKILTEEAAELIPERDSIARQVNRLSRRREIATRLKMCQKSYYAQELNRIKNTQNQVSKQVHDNNRQIISLNKRDILLRKKSSDLADAANSSARQHELALRALSDLDVRRAQIVEALTRGEVELERLNLAIKSEESKEHSSKSKTRLQKKLSLYNSQLLGQSDINDGLATKISVFDEKIRDLTKQLSHLRQALRSNQRAGYIGQALGLAQLLSRQLAQDKSLSRQQLRIILHKLIRIVKLAHESDLADAPEKIAKLQQQISREMTKREEVIEKQTAVIIRIRSLEMDIHALEREITLLNEPEDTNKQQSLKVQVQKQQKMLAKLCRDRDLLDSEQEKLRRQLSLLSQQNNTQSQVDIARELEESRQQILTCESEKAQLVISQKKLEAEHSEVMKQAKSWGISAAEEYAGETVSRDDITRLETELTLIGEIDETLVEAHREISERVDYLKGQAQDMQHAAEDLEKVLSELERRIKSTFQKNFAKINTAFGKNFNQLFGGGRAELTLSPLDDDSYGIDIIAQPPAKRLSTLSALSGGEKALSAISLLAAILEVNPSPFIVLDEVDAALDDRNANLFQKTLAQLAKRSQILVITHNHETMVHADRLYGVSAGSRSASTVLAVDLASVETTA